MTNTETELSLEELERIEKSQMIDLKPADSGEYLVKLLGWVEVR